MQVLQPALPSTKWSFPSGQVAQAIQVEHRVQLPLALQQLGLSSSHPVLVVIGGACKFEHPDYDRLQQLFEESLAPLAEDLGMIIVDGGTDTGVMQLMGTARSKLGGTFPLVGVAPIHKVYLPNQLQNPGTHPLEPHHTHFILVPGSKWGDESPWIAAIASQLSGAFPSLTLLMNGGNVSLVDVRASVAERRPVVVITGTGRLADEIATALRSPSVGIREELSPVIHDGRFTLFDLSKPTTRLKTQLKRYFSGKRYLGLRATHTV